MEKNLKCFIALDYLLIKYDLIDSFAKCEYLEGKWCINASAKDLYEICFFENGRKTKQTTIRYPEFACCYILDVLLDEKSTDLIKEFCGLLAMQQSIFNEITWPVITQYEIEKSIANKAKKAKKENTVGSNSHEKYVLGKKQLHFLYKEQIKANKAIKGRCRTLKK